MTESSFDDAVARGEEAARRALAKHKDAEDVVVALDAYDVETAARDALEAGLCVIRASTDGKKQPVGDWKHWQDRLPSQAQVATWFGDGHPAMGIVTGKVSDNLEMLEFEGRAVDAGVVGRFRVLIREAGLWGDWERIARGYSEKTPSGGYHVLWRCERIAGNTPLARRPSTDAELAENPQGLLKVLIETRGEGGFVVCAPTTGAAHPSGIGWTREHGSFATIATIHPELRDRIFAIARQLDEMPEEAPRVRPQGDEKGDGGTLPDFDLTCEDVVKAARFQFHHTDRKGNQHWTRPGKDIREGSSLTIWADDGRATPWSSSINAPAEFVTGQRQLTPWQLHVALRHQGDFQGAARAWRRSHPTVVREVPREELAPAGVDPETGELAEDTGGDTPPPGGPYPVIAEEFWERPRHAQIRQIARARCIAPDALLGAVLAHVAAYSPFQVVLPSIIGSPAPINVIHVIAAESGIGKGASTDVARELIHPPNDQIRDHTYVTNVGSGEGICHAYYKDVLQQSEKNGQDVTVNERFYDSVLFDVDEGEALAKLLARTGQTTGETVRSAWSGKGLGAAYANSDKRKPVKAGTYRFTLLMGLQPRVASPLLSDDAGGTPQRFLWFSSIDPDVPDELPDEPSDFTWSLPSWNGPTALVAMTHRGPRRFMEVDPAIGHEIREHHRERLSGRRVVGRFDSHRNLVKLKTAALISMFDERYDITLEDWAYAEILLTASDAVREFILNTLSHEENRREAGRNVRAATRAAAEQGARRGVDDNVVRVARIVANRVHREETPLTRKELKDAVGSRNRRWLDDAASHAEAMGWVLEDDDGKYLAGESRPI